MERGIRNTMPRIVAATAFGAVVALSACKKNDNAAADSTAMATPADTTMPMTPAPAASTAPAMTDAGIVAMVVAANQGEIAAGKMAQSKASNADVKAFGRMMVTDHGKMLSEGNALAKRLNITPDTAAADSIMTANKTMADMLTAAPKGATFDTAYVNGQVMGHENTLAMLKTAADQAQNADLKKMLTDAQTPVQRHLDRIKDIQGKMQ